MRTVSEDIFVDHATGNDANTGFGQNDSVRTLERAMHLAATPLVRVNDTLFPDCCEKPWPRHVWALLSNRCRTHSTKRIRAALSCGRFVAECENCGAAWLPDEMYPGFNTLWFRGVEVRAATMPPSELRKVFAGR